MTSARLLKRIEPFSYLGHIVSAEISPAPPPIWIVTIDGVQRGAFPCHAEKEESREVIMERLRDFTDRHRNHIEQTSKRQTSS